MNLVMTGKQQFTDSSAYPFNELYNQKVNDSTESTLWLKIGVLKHRLTIRFDKLRTSRLRCPSEGRVARRGLACHQASQVLPSCTATRGPDPGHGGQ